MHFSIVIIVICVATSLGSLCGIGGGVIIKPVLDAVSSFSKFQIALISTSCVLTTCSTSVIKHLIYRTKVNLKESLVLAVGGILGGIAGTYFFNFIRDIINDSYPETGKDIITLIQNAGIGFLIFLVLLYMLTLKKKGVSYHLNSLLVVGIIGVFLGMISVFLDIGGGAINVCIFILLFSMNVKSAAVNSLLVIVFSQITKLIQYVIMGNFKDNVTFDDTLTWWLFVILIITSVITGIIGSHFNKKIDASYIDLAYDGSLVGIILIAGYNVVNISIKLAK
ncbi:transmembrane protein TauE like protein [Neocallimastix lanati (nom. inval.)]|jgi:hypothetical protein|uniref:Membrane transporter protein n=1 Tax=Neocallimastix californiae TaxID=1754190 RepID=A0A1Y2EGI7_9FUNG|nr:transmembrane protein TauE like protein [Neocallimastix sp. JGI-2020a]ORY70689.1 hypothetical protein LY90DRAFT_504025 [Neocallimastix californiae]|eukprot:ORY70689.1 hypothetical protein LY90DRAFT_504025 [Neocallimastix californiae]